MSEEGSTSYRANLQRGELLWQQERYAESEKYLQQALAEQPNEAEGYHQLAFCYCNWPKHSKQALKFIDRAIALSPNQPEFFGLRAWILDNLDKQKEALNVAGQALALDPQCLLALNAQTRAYINLNRWVDAEKSARRTLEMFARNQLAKNFLAIALRHQGRLQDSEAVTDGLLSEAPESAMAHNNVGWSALQAGDHQRANRHFLESLRLEPGYENARRGLMHSFNSRVWIYRIYYQFIAWLARYQRGTRIALFGLIYVGYRFFLTELRLQFGSQGVTWGVVVIALYLVVFGFGRSFANLFLLLDPFARHALTRKEKLWSLLAGAIYASLLISLITSRAWPQTVVLVGVALIFLWGVLSPRFQASSQTQLHPSA